MSCRIATWSLRHNGTRSSSMRSREEAKLVNHQLIVSQFLAGSLREGILSRKSDGLPADRYLRALLRGDQQPLVRFRKPRGHSSLRRRFLGFSLLHLVRREVQCLLLFEDGFPSQKFSYCLVQIL